MYHILVLELFKDLNNSNSYILTSNAPGHNPVIRL